MFEYDSDHCFILVLFPSEDEGTASIFQLPPSSGTRSREPLGPQQCRTKPHWLGSVAAPQHSNPEN